MKMKKSKKLESWIAKNQPNEKFSSVLMHHKDEIQFLYENNYSQNQILNFLDEAYQIKTTQQNLSNFIIRHIENKNASTKKTAKKDEKNIQKSKFDEIDKKFGGLV